MLRTLTLLVLSAALTFAANEGKPADDAGKKDKDKIEPKIVRTEGEVTIAGEAIQYTAETATIVLKTDDGKPRATVFHVSYLRNGVDDPASRPVVFAFNGGPGSSAVWLHLGCLGPKRVEIPDDGTSPPVPPLLVTDNPDSVLDVADLVLIDPVSTGYSRAAGETKPAEFHGLTGDVESVGDFIRRWISEHNRWRSPKFLLGESYGGVRAAGLSQHLQRRYGMSLNGVVLVSSLLDFRTVGTSSGDDLSDIIYLPAFTAVARYHERIQGDPAALRAAAREFACGPYAAALLQGHQLPDDQRKAVASRYAELTGLPVDFVLGSNLRINPTRFRAELLRDQGEIIGRFDARVTCPTEDTARPSAGADPSFDFIFGAFSTAMLDYLHSSLDWTAEKPYEIFGKVGAWKWDANNQHVNLSSDLADAISTNPHLRVLVMAGHTDLATPAAGMEYSINHLPLPNELLTSIEFRYYDGGHMFYLNPPDRAKMRKDLVEFIAGS